MPGPRNSPKAFADWYESDYFRRPRRPWAWTATIVGAMLLAGAGIAWTFARPGGQTAYQAGPLSDPHAFLADNCAACHTEKFVTAGRLLPGHENDRATPDAACLRCHQAGVHHPNQTQFVGATGPNGQSAANCAGCHPEHNGGPSIARLADTSCISCHADLQTTAGPPKFADHIKAFDDGHPAFGAWRGGPLTDPGTLKFSHEAHLKLAQDFDTTPGGRNAWMGDAMNRLKDLSCTACHEPDNDRRYILPVSYDRHCAACHPLTVPAGDATSRLHHPERGETAEVVRAELLERFWKQVVGQRPGEPNAPATVRPEVLNRPLSAEDRDRIQKLARQEESRQFDANGYVLATLERPQFQLKSGCAYCHEEQTTPATRPDGLPVYKSPRLRDRWQDVTFPHERFGAEGNRSLPEQSARNRWFPYAKFGHESHRMLECTACHEQARESAKASDVLMPTIGICQKCHNSTAAGVRSDCLECHNYHDRHAEPHGLDGRMTVDDVMRLVGPPTGR